MKNTGIKRILIATVALSIICFAALITYYIVQEDKVKKNEIAKIVEKQNELDYIDKSPSDETNDNTDSYKAEDSQTAKDYYKKADEELKKMMESKESLEESEMNKIYNQAIQKIRVAAMANDFDTASSLAIETVNKYNFEHSYQIGALYSINDLRGFLELPDFDKYEFASYVTDPVVYVAAFYKLKPEYQAELLPNDSYLFINVNDSNPITFINVEKAGAYESRAYEFFDDLAECDISKVEIEVNSVRWNIYVTGKEGHSHRITNIEVGKEFSASTSYSDYFNVYGREPIKKYFD